VKRSKTYRVMDDLTPHERALVLLVTQGLSHAEIAKRLGQQRQTISDRISDLALRMGLRDEGKRDRPSHKLMLWGLSADHGGD